MTILHRAISLTALVFTLSACSNMEPLQTVDQVDLDAFMGDWYVIANIPTVIEKGAHNAMEASRRPLPFMTAVSVVNSRHTNHVVL